MTFTCPNCGTDWDEPACDNCGRNLMPRRAHDTFPCADDHRRIGECDYEACGCSCHRTAVTTGGSAAVPSPVPTPITTERGPFLTRARAALKEEV